MSSKPIGSKSEKEQSCSFYKFPYSKITEALQEELKKAFFDNDWSLMRQLLVQGAFIDYRYGWDGKTLLFNCDSVDKIKALVSMGADVNAQNINGSSVLVFSILERWSLDSVRLLLKYGANVNTSDFYGYSPLAKAVYYENLELIKLMMEYKASINGTDKFISPYSLTVNKNCAKMLVKYGVLHGEDDDCKKCIEFKRQIGLVNLEEENYMKACIAEVTLLKQELINEEYSLFDYLNRSQNHILPFVPAIDIGKFPIYADVIKETVDRVTQRKRLLNEFNVVRVHTRSGKETVNLNYDEIFKIAQHLDNDDLENLVSAFKI